MRSQSALSAPVNSSLCWIYPETRSQGEVVRGPRMEESLRMGMSVEDLHNSGKQTQKAERCPIRQEARGGGGGRGRGEDIGNTPSSSSVRLWNKESHMSIAWAVLPPPRSTAHGLWISPWDPPYGTMHGKNSSKSSYRYCSSEIPVIFPPTKSLVFCEKREKNHSLQGVTYTLLKKSSKDTWYFTTRCRGRNNPPMGRGEWKTAWGEGGDVLELLMELSG